MYCTWLSVNSCLFLLEESLGFLFLACCLHLFALIPERPLVLTSIYTIAVKSLAPALHRSPAEVAVPFQSYAEWCQHSHSARRTSCSEMLCAVASGLLHTRGACVCQCLLLLSEKWCPLHAALERAVSLPGDMCSTRLWSSPSLQHQGTDALSGCWK